jgi:hypothetical protein
MKRAANNPTSYDNETLVGSAIWTQRECARQLKMSERKLDRLHKMGKGPPRFRIGQRWYYFRESVLTWLKSLEKPTPDLSSHKRPAIGERSTDRRKTGTSN